MRATGIRTERQLVVRDALIAGAHTSRQVMDATGLPLGAVHYALTALCVDGEATRRTDNTGRKFLYFITAQAGK